VARPRLGVIAAGGRGTRIHPRSMRTPKVLLEAGGKPLLHRQIELLRDALGIARVLIVTGHLDDQVRASCGDGASFGIEIHYAHNPDVERGLATALLAIEPLVDERFVLILGDELYLETNHAGLVDSPEALAVCALLPSDDPEVIRKNYGVVLDGERITSLVEKPETPPSPWAGCGTWVLDPAVFAHAHATAPSARTGRLELVDVLDRAARSGEVVLPFPLEGHYLNVNTVEDLNQANFLCRSLHFAAHKTSLVVPAYNEAASIGYVIRDFAPHVDEIVVMDNCSPDGTGEIARALGAVVHSRRLRGYGDALRQGIEAASGDILVLVEADATFRARDLGKLLEYLKDADMVVGTRTTRQLIEQGANMDGLLRWGNVAVGKLIEVLWWSLEPRFTDVGCTYRAIWRDAWLKIRGYITRDDAAFSPEMMIEILRSEGRVVEIPVSYHRRRGGASKHSASRWHSARTGLRMLRLIAEKRLNLA
jgi:dTDP-glucose pyrophosphorylase